MLIQVSYIYCFRPKNNFVFNFEFLINLDTQGVSCTTVSDIIFVLDESESIKQINFDLMKDFVKAIIQVFNTNNPPAIDSAKMMVRVGIVSYSIFANPDVPIGDYNDVADLQNKFVID